MTNPRLSAALFLLASIAFSVAAQDTGRTAVATWRVDGYDIDLTAPSEASRSMAARATLNLRNVSGRPATSLTLRISPLAEVSSIRLNGAAAEFSKNEEKINTSASLQRIVLRLPSVPADGLVTAIIDYKLNLKDNSALASASPAGLQLLPLSYWYPTPNSWYFARGGDYAPVKVKVNAAAGQVIASGAESGGAFEQKLRSQPFIVSGTWDIQNVSGISVYGPKGTGSEGQKRAAELAAVYSDARTFVAGLLGPAPDTPVRIVAARRGAGFGAGGTVLVDEAAFRRPKIDSQTAMNLSEAAVRLWLGGSVAITGEGHGILSEGLVRYLATQFIESKFGKDIADIERLRQRNAYSAVSRRDAPMMIVSPIDDYYYPVVANKGAMAWRLIAKRVGQSEFIDTIKRNLQDKELNVAELRAGLSNHKVLIDLLFDQVTETNLLVGLPQSASGVTKVNLRNTGSADVTIDVEATTTSGQRLVAPTTIRSASFGEVVFKTSEKVTKVEVDTEKLYPQTDYSDDVAPRETTDSDPLLAVKRAFDKQDFSGAETLARVLLSDLPRFDDLRILLGRSLLAQNKTSDAEREFKAILDEKLPTARSLAWAYVGLADIASRSGQNDAALRNAEAAISTDAEYGASFAARNIRNKLGSSQAADPAVKAFFAEFDKAATANRKADLEGLAMPGEVNRFISGMVGSVEQWQTTIRHIDRIDANTLLIEANMSIKLLNREIETGVAVFRLGRTGNAWKLTAVDMFEVR